jgi:uncharacterized protein (DUF169 family)
VRYLTEELIRQDHQEAAEAVRRVPELNRRQRRELFEKRSTATRLIHDYVEVYERPIRSDRGEALEACV